MRYTQGLYFRMKDLVFVGARPYSEKPLEDILKKELGENTFMSDVKGVKYVLYYCIIVSISCLEFLLEVEEL